MAFNPMDLNNDGHVDFSDYMLFNTYINPRSSSYYRRESDSALVSKVVNYLSNSPNDTIEMDEFRSACYACNVDPDSFTADDYAQLQKELSELP